jgi:hypothetical protein
LFLAQKHKGEKAIPHARVLRLIKPIPPRTSRHTTIKELESGLAPSLQEMEHHRVKLAMVVTSVLAAQRNPDKAPPEAGLFLAGPHDDVLQIQIEVAPQGVSSQRVVAACEVVPQRIGERRIPVEQVLDSKQRSVEESA